MTGETDWAALGRGLAAHPDDAFVLLRAVRDRTGAVVDLMNEWVNPTAERNAGERLQGRTVLEVYSVEDAFLLPDQRALLASGGSRCMQLTFPADGDDERLRGRVYGLFMVAVDADRLVCQYRDLTEQRELQARLEHHAGHDELTGLPNRRLLWEHLEVALARLERGGRCLAMLLCDLDRFKAVNDTHGHAVGDEVLRQVARRLRATVRPQDVLVRYGGDEFVVLCEELSAATAVGLVGRLREAAGTVFVVDGVGPVEIGISIGMAVAERPLPGDALLLEADRALYADKLARRSKRVRGSSQRQ